MLQLSWSINSHVCFNYFLRRELSWRHSKRILVPTHTPTKWSRRKEESTNTRGSTGHVAWEKHAELLLGRSGIYGCLSHESMHHERSAWGNSIRAPCRKEADPVAPQGVRKHCECTHPERTTTEVRREVREMYPRRILVQEEGIQVLQPFNPRRSHKSRCSLQRVYILVRTGDCFDSDSTWRGLRRTRGRSRRSAHAHEQWKSDHD